jgi:glutamate-1-semialdehyde 2,1-aminomutase
VLPADLTVLETTLAAARHAAVIRSRLASMGDRSRTIHIQLRRLTMARDVLLICDEVVTGFRVAPGGVGSANIRPT